MVRIVALTIAITLAATSYGRASGGTEPKTVTSTGWFSDISCAESRVKRGLIGPNNPDCIKRCLDEGKTAVFISKEAKAFYEVKNYPTVREDLGWYVELTGTIDAEGKTIAVQSVKRIEYSGPQCALQKKKPAAN